MQWPAHGTECSHHLLLQEERDSTAIPCGVANQTGTYTLSKRPIRRICTHFRVAQSPAHSGHFDSEIISLLLSQLSPWGKVTTFPVSISRRVPSGLHFSALAKCPQCPTSASASDFGVQSPALPSSHPWASHPFWSFFGVLLNAATCRSCCLSVPLLCCVLWFWPLESKVQPLPSATMTTRPQKLVK